MQHPAARRYAVSASLAIFLAIGLPINPPQSANAQAGSDDVTFASKKEAEDFLKRYLPIATAGNPKYRDDKGAVTQWLTKTIAFNADPSRGILVSTSEEIIEFENGAKGRVGSHEAAFSMQDVQVSERKDATDRTENGERALGIIFNCISGKCINAKWDGNPSSSAWTDIYLQDAALRAKILKAFQTLK